MIPTLALAVLSLAAGSDPESSDEEAWEKQFRETDRLRKLWGVPPLTPQERFSWILGRPAPRDTHVVYVVHVSSVRKIGGEESATFFERYEILIYRFMGTTYKEEPLWIDRGTYRWVVDHWREAEKTAESLADTLYLFYSEENPVNSIGIPKFKEK